MPVEFSKDNVATLGTTDADLTSAFTTAEISYVATDDDTTYVAQSGSLGYAVFNFEQVVTGSNAVIKWDGKSNIAPSESPVKLQIYNRTSSVWQDLASEVSAAADTDFTISAVVSTLTDYQEVSTNVVACRVWQAASAPPASAWTVPAEEIAIDGTGANLITFGAAFNDVNLSTVVPAGTKLVLLHVRNTSTDTAYACDTKMNGSSDPQTPLELSPEYHTTLIAALDGSLIFDGYFSNAALAVGITAYSSSGAGLATRVTVGPTVGSAWTDKDVSANVAAGSTVAFISITAQTIGRRYAVHKDGSSMDTNSAYAAEPSHPGLVVTGLTSGVFEYYSADGANEYSCFLAAYDDQIIELADKLDVTPGVSTTWTDCDCSSVVPAGSVAALVMLKLIQYTGTPRQLNVRAKGSTDNIITNVKTDGSGSITTLVKLDGSRVFQGYTGLTGYAGIYVIGYIPGS